MYFCREADRLARWLKLSRALMAVAQYRPWSVHLTIKGDRLKNVLKLAPSFPRGKVQSYCPQKLTQSEVWKLVSESKDGVLHNA